ncbi:adhesin domain containing protein [Pseudoglutamicibacter albus]|uniref:adhesin domain containing protein n=1 Tax=Pseudoglutamicibacter albus TaxID=98671 RepID=UPI00360E2C12
MRTPHNTRGLKRSARSSLTALSVIALTGSSLAIAPSFFSAEPAAAASALSGGIRDKAGAVEQEQQKPSDLLAGSCEVFGGGSSGSQAGFTWTTLEPSQHSADKTIWGLSLAFDNSKDRTFAAWGFSNSGLLSGVLDPGTISSMDVGQTLFGAEGPVTAKADEQLEIKASRSQRNLILSSELTGDKVKQYAQADAGNPVRYAWQGKYTKDNIDGRKATQGQNAGFTAVVNPWPSENDNCSPISVSWENREKLVVTPGEKLKVGRISADAPSMPRMVVEAYDSQGKFIGTSNTEASGGQARLRVEDNGDVYFTVPEYKGTELNAQQGVRFSVLALPRSVEQLQAAIDADADSYGQAFQESNALPRYNKANVIDSHQWSLDDTQFHDPKYDKRDASIISGVESPQGPLAKDRQSVTFTQVPDLIKDLVKKKEDGGFEADVELDEKYVYEGWDATLDPETYNVTVTAPKNPTPGTFAQPRVVITYSNGSKDELPLLVVVDPNNTQVTDLVKPAIAQGKPNQDIDSQIKTKAIMKGHKAVAPAKYEVDDSSVPSGWTVTVDKNGKVTAKADDTVPLGTVISPKVKATYPDHTTDEVEVQFQVVNDIKVPTYGTETKKPGEKASLKPTLPEKGLSGKESDEAPSRYTFEDGTTTLSKDGWTVTIDENTGEISTEVPRDAEPGDQLDIPVLAHYASGAKPQEATATVFVIKGDDIPTYTVESTGPGNSVDHQVSNAPKGSTFSFGKDGDQPILEQEVDGWKYTINPDTGVVTATPLPIPSQVIRRPLTSPLRPQTALPRKCQSPRWSI